MIFFFLIHHNINGFSFSDWLQEFNTQSDSIYKVWIAMLERVRLGGFSGTYKLRNAELARDKKKQTIGVSILFLDDCTHIFYIEVRLTTSIVN